MESSWYSRQTARFSISKGEVAGWSEQSSQARAKILQQERVVGGYEEGSDWFEEGVSRAREINRSILINNINNEKAEETTQRTQDRKGLGGIRLPFTRNARCPPPPTHVSPSPFLCPSPPPTEPPLSNLAPSVPIVTAKKCTMLVRRAEVAQGGEVSSIRNWKREISSTTTSVRTSDLSFWLDNPRLR